MSYAPIFKLSLLIPLISAGHAFADPFKDYNVTPNSAVAYRWRGEYYDEKREYDNAIADYTAAMTYDTGDDFNYRLR